MLAVISPDSTFTVMVVKIVLITNERRVKEIYLTIEVLIDYVRGRHF